MRGMRPLSAPSEDVASTLAAPIPNVFGLPLVPSLLVMFMIVFGLAHAFYWAARLLGGRLLESRIGRRLRVDRLRHAQSMIDRYGPGALAVLMPLPGMRSAVPAGAGLAGLSYPRFVIGAAIGAAAWTTVWILGGLAVVWSWVQVTIASPVAGVAILVAGVAGVVLLVRWRRARHAAPSTPGEDEPVG